MNYLNETLWIGRLGQAGISLAWASALMFLLCYAFARKGEPLEQRQWLNWGRIAFAVHLFSNLLVFASLLHILYYHLFEYYYAYQHSSKNLSLKFILSALWEGQEGSFLLWALWNALLAGIFILFERAWEAVVMPVLGLMQVLLFTMLLGIWLGDWQIGSSPFVLLRNKLAIPLFEHADYLTKLPDGRGLNALLQNYWMVIHPPFLFLGFALSLFPFAIVIGSFLRGEYTAFAKVLLRWALWAAGFLGLGIMMGAAWAYESLTFGGYWAWDPVENASLVPWLLLVSALHLNVVYLKTHKYWRLCVLLYIFAFLSVLYSTYLTRSGILGNTSVHSFTDLGMNGLLLFFLGIFIISSLLIYYLNRSKLPKSQSEDYRGSRELYLFLGTVILILSAVLISLQTSLPVINKILHTQFAPPKDLEYSFNQHQIFAVWGIALLSSLALLASYGRQPNYAWYKKIIIISILSLCLAILAYLLAPVFYDKKGAVFAWAIIVAYVLSFFMLITNVFLLYTAMRRGGNLLKQGAFLAHIGFAILLIGILISSTGKKVLSWNVDTFSPLNMQDEEKPFENLTLIKGIPARMGDYQVCYQRDTLVENEGKVYYVISFQNQKDASKSFILRPDIIKNTKGMEGVSPNPDAKHRWNGDIFSYLTFLSEPDTVGENHSKFRGDLQIGDTLFLANSASKQALFGVKFIKLQRQAGTQNLQILWQSARGELQSREIVLAEGDFANMEFWGDLRGSKQEYYQVQVQALSQSEYQKKYQLTVNYSLRTPDFITLKVYEFPFIMLVWLGVIIMCLGFFLTAYARYKF